MKGEPDRINLSMEVVAGLKLDQWGDYQPLSAEEWVDGKRRLEAPGPLPAPDPSVVATHGTDVAYLPDSGDLSLTPAAIPESTAPEAVIPGGQGDRVVVDRGDAEGRGGRVARKSADGGATRWVTPLDGYVGSANPPEVAADADRAYVMNYVMREAGMTALDARTGKVLWHSPGSADRMLLSGDLLLAADISVGVDGKGGGRWLIARRVASGQEAFRVALPANDFNALPIEEAAGWFVVTAHDPPGGSGASLLIDRTGRVRHRLDRQVMAVTARGEDRLVLTSRDVIRLGDDGPPRWTAPFAGREWIAGGGLVPLAGGDVVAYLYGRINDSGVQVLRLDPRTGRKMWEGQCRPLGVTHSEYDHRAVVEVSGGRLLVTSRGSGGTFVEALDAQTGHSVARRVIKHCQ
jgi:outer membrane protein assembly factor BamB